MSSVARVIADYLEAQGVGQFAGSADWSLNVSREPVAPSNCITIYDTGGDDPDTDEQDERATFQVRVRCVDYEAGISKHRAIRDFLILPSSVSVLSFVVMTSAISAIGRDDNDRHLIVASYRTVLERT